MIEIRKITAKDKYHSNTAIKYVVQLGELKSYLTEKVLIELKGKLNEFVLHNVVGQSEQLKGFVDWFNKTDKTQSILNERVNEYIKTL